MVTAKRLIAGGALVALLILGAAYFYWERSGGESPAEVERDSTRQIRRAMRYAVVPSVRPELSWMYERGIEPRRIAGRVTIDGRPAAGIDVSLRSEAMMHSKLSAPTRRSDAEGRFDFGVWPATQYAVVAGGGEYELAIEKVDLANPLVESEEVEVRLDACSREGFGTVTSLYGEEIAEATLSVAIMMRPANRFIVASEAIESDGSFRLCLSRDRTDLRIDAPGFAQASIYEYEGNRMPKEGWQVRLLPAGAIRGHYVDSQGRGIAGGRVGIFRQGISHNLSIWQHTISDPDGSFAFTAVGPGKYEVAVDHFDYMLETDWQTVSLAPGEEKDGIVVTGGDCRRIAGTVVTEADVPVAGAEVWGQARSQADGSFVITCALFEDFELDMPTHQVLTPLIPAGTEDMTDLVVRVASPKSLSGRVVAGGEPVANAAITLRSEEMGSMPFLPRSTQRTRSDDTGHYHFGSVVPGSYSLETSTEQGASDKLSLQMGESDLEYNLTIKPGTQVSGTVSTEDGVLLSGIKVQFASSTGKESSVITESGRFQIMVSGSESHEVSLRHKFSEQYEPPVGAPWPTIEAGAGELTLDLRIAGGSQKLSGQVAYEDGSPVPHARVTVFPTAQDQEADEKGHFVFENLPESSLSVFAKDLMGLKGSVEDIEASNGIAEGIRVVIEQGATIAGTIIDGTPACSVKLQGRDRRNAQGASFVFDDLSSGEYAIEAQCDQAVAAKATTVSPGGRVELSLELEAGLSIDGIVKQFPTGEPIADLDCTAGMAEAKTGSDGRFQLSHVAPLVTEIRCMRFQNPMAFAQGSLSASKGARQEIEVWGAQSSVGMEALMKDSGRLGASLTVENDQVVFTEVEASGACAQLGILDGDVLLTVASIRVVGNEKVAEFYLQTLPVGESVEIEIRRGEEEMTFTFGQ